MISPLGDALIVAENEGARRGRIAHGFHRWLTDLARSILSPFRLDTYTGSQTIESTQHAIVVKRLEMRGTDRLTAKGSARLVGLG